MESDDFTRYYIIRYLSVLELVLPPPWVGTVSYQRGHTTAQRTLVHTTKMKTDREEPRVDTHAITFSALVPQLLLAFQVCNG